MGKTSEKPHLKASFSLTLRWSCKEHYCIMDAIRILLGVGCMIATARACQDGETKMEDCNSCRCISGLWACTRKLCPEQGKREESECQNGETKTEDCNTCLCSNGFWACTEMYCFGKKSECQDGETKMEDCNTCSCSGGIWACTLMFCFPKPEPECQEGETKMVDCNTCHCNGGRWACTLMMCLGKQTGPVSEISEVCIEASGTRQCFPAKREESCMLGDAKKLDCNDCTCAGYGGTTFWLCTMMSCLSKKEIAANSDTTCVSAAGTVQCFPSKREAPVCADGDTKEMDCNKCLCSGGQWACTLAFCINSAKAQTLERRKTCVQAGNVRQCFDKREDGALEKCTSGRNYKIDCNWCICQNEEWLCTLKSCHSNLRALTKRSVIEAKGICNDEEVRMKGCNTCVCIGGEWMCTERMCRAIQREKREVEGEITGDKMTSSILNKREICQEEEAKRKDCNICVCMGGEWMCTQRMCRAIKPVKRGEEEEKVAKVERKVVRECTRGENKMDDCNRCICLGGNWACTLRFCS